MHLVKHLFLIACAIALCLVLAAMPPIDVSTTEAMCHANKYACGLNITFPID